MNKVLAGAGLLVATGGIGLTVMALRHVRRTPSNTFVGPVRVDGLTRDEAAHRLRVWWESEKVRSLTLQAAGETLEKLTPAQLGLKLDDQATADKLPYRDFAGTLTASLGTRSREAIRTDAEFHVTERKELESFAQGVAKRLGKGTPARAAFIKGKVEVHAEIPGKELDRDSLLREVASALGDGREEIEVPLRSADKRISDESLSAIEGVAAEFSTTFSTAKRSRCSNIKLASSRFEGLVLAPGDTLSFNGIVGRRSVESGYQIAGVYRNGRHDFDLGGGICQVSTTLYNAALLGGLKVVKRSNHSMPVPYVPVGRDATVDYGVIDLVLQNDKNYPIAVAPEYVPGRLTFRILGKPDPHTKVKILAEGHRSWSAGVETTVDPRLAPGKKVVIEQGSSGHEVVTYRVTTQGGKEVSREALGRSYYRGGKRIVAVGPAAEKATAPEKPTAPVPPAPSSNLD